MLNIMHRANPLRNVTNRVDSGVSRRRNDADTRKQGGDGGRGLRAVTDGDNVADDADAHSDERDSRVEGERLPPHKKQS